MRRRKEREQERNPEKRRQKRAGREIVGMGRELGQGSSRRKSRRKELE